MQFRFLAPLILAVGFIGYAPSLAHADELSDAGNRVSTECRDVTLARKPGWTLSGGFTSDGSQLLVVDSLYNTILRYSDSGESLGPIQEPIKSVVADQLPVTGKVRGNNFILEVSDGLMLMDQNLHPVVTKSMMTNRDRRRITGLWEWQPVGKTDIVAFVDFGEEPVPYDPRHARTGFVRFPLQDPGAFEVLGKDFKVFDTPNKGYFRSTYSYITSLGETAYYLSMNQGLALYKQAKGKQPEEISRLLPKELRAPQLPDWISKDDFVDMMGRIERESMPVGLFGWNDSLYLLYRKPQPQGRGTRWMLYTIDPSGKTPSSAAELPIRANHVTVIPGPKGWAFLEKGPVRAFGAQSIPRALFIPSQFLKAPLRSGKLCGQ